MIDDLAPASPPSSGEAPPARPSQEDASTSPPDLGAEGGAPGPEWHAWRRGGIGGSDIAAIVGLSPWGSPWSVWAEKVGLTNGD